MRKFYFLTGLAIWFMISTSAAQETGNETDEPDYLEMTLEELMNIEVVSASQSKQKATDAPATIHVITEEQIMERGYFNLEELLEDIPEIEIQKKSVAEYSNYISVRGIAGNEKFLILLDGIRINSMAGTPHVVGANYSLANARRVEIILGPASALYGVDAFSGIINIITKTGDEMGYSKLRASYGNFGTTDNALSLGYGNEDFSFNLTGSYYYSDEPFFPDYYEDEYAWYTNQYSENGNMRLAPFLPDVIVPTGTPREYETPTEAYFIDVGINAKNIEVGYTRNLESHNSSMGMRPEYNIYARDAVYEILIEDIYGKHTFTSQSEKWTIQSNLYLGSYELTPDSKFLNTFTSYRNGYKYAFHRAFTIREQASYKFNAQSSIVGGISFQDINALAKSGDLPFRFDKDVPADLQNLYYLGTNTTDMNGNDLTINQDFYYITQRNLGAFAQYQNKFNDALSLTLGMRYDYNTRYGSSFNPRAGLIWSASSDLKIKLLYGEAFLAPSVYKAYQHYGSFITVDADNNSTSNPDETVGLFGPFWHLTNPDLEPEKLRTVETGVSYVKNNISLAFDGYYNDITNLITNSLIFDQSFNGVEVDAVEVPVNKGEAYTYGFTAKVDYFYQTGRVILKNYLSYSYSDGEIEDNPLSYSAQHTVKAGVVAKIGKFSINPRVIYRSESLHGILRDANGDLESNDSFALVNLFSRYTFSDKLSAFVKVRNLFDQRYYNVSFAQDEGFASTPQDPIRVLGGVTVKL
ncbi:TonB-dependent receptor [Fulvivirga ulvae]|uniref:TonB-dependent receptor plug domain-containing protein n=1 Tax=Fulvivirga ulvae TaxID=2904245 RepID=UPI001F480C11|nr:TonB-dependent receptor [Fulvivirga ulvae]UII30474.1 TonB-dependent receptor [Fulvivirga ulvae]